MQLQTDNDSLGGRVVIFGAGPIGRGVVAPLVRRNSLGMAFVCSTSEQAFAMNAAGQYTVREAGCPDSNAISEFRAFPSENSGLCDEASRLRFVFTAVRAKNLPSLAGPLAILIRARLAAGLSGPWNVICCENMPVDENPIYRLRQALEDWSNDANYVSFIKDRLGLVGAVIDATALTASSRKPGCLDVVVAGGFSEILIDATAIKGNLPDFLGLCPVQDLRVHRERKLFIHGLGHAALGYLCHAKGLHNIADGMRDVTIRAVVRAAMRESADALSLRYPNVLHHDSLTKYVEDLLNCFADSSLADTVERVGRDTFLKLGPEERILGAIRNAEVTTGRAEALRIVLCAALEYAREQGAIDETAPAGSILAEHHNGHSLIGLWSAYIARTNLEESFSSFVDRGCDLRVFPRVLVLDVDGTLTDKVEEPLRPEIAELIIKLRDAGVNIVILSGLSKRRFTELILPALKRAGGGDNVTVFGGCGAFGLRYDKVWTEQELHHVSFSALERDSIEIRLFTESEVQDLITLIREAIPGAVAELRDTHIVVRVESDARAKLSASALSAAVAASKLNGVLRERLLSARSGFTDAVRLNVRVSRGGLINVLLLTKGDGLYFALRDIEERYGGVCEGHHTLVLDDSINDEGGGLYSGNELVRVRVGQFSPIVLNVGPPASSHLSTVIDVGPPAGPVGTVSILRRLLGAFSRGNGLPVNDAATASEGLSGASSSRRHLAGQTLLLKAADHPDTTTYAKTVERVGPPGERFEDSVSVGVLRPVIIVSIKDLYPGAPASYLQEFYHLRHVYNGNATFLLAVQPPAAINHDYPSLFTTIQRARENLGSLFYDRPVLIVADAGRKTRNFPLTLRYGFQGLFPFSAGRSYLREVIARAGNLFLNTPTPSDYLVAVASDSVLDLHSVKPQPARLSIPLAPLPDTLTLSERVLALLDSTGRVSKVIAKPSGALELQLQQSFHLSALWTLPFATIWPKRAILHPLLETLESTLMNNGSSFINAPTDLYHGLVEGLYATADEWQSRRPPSMSADDWATIRAIALAAFGPHGTKISYPLLPPGGFRDEGHIRIARRRIEDLNPMPLSTVSVDPRVRVTGAFFATGARAVVKGRGLLRIGKGVHLTNVLIDMGDNGGLTIPDGWTLHDTYIHASCQFEGVNGFLSGVFRSTPPSHHILPAMGETFSGSQCTTIVLSRSGENLRVDIPLTACKDVLAALRVGTDRWNLQALQDQTDILAGAMGTDRLTAIIGRELASAPPVFPIEPNRVRIVSRVRYAQWVRQLASEIIARKESAGLFWVTLEGLQGAGKSYLAAVLRKELRSRGLAATIIEEDWSHFSRPIREQLRTTDPARFACHRETWHDWDRNRKIVRTLAHAEAGYVTLHGLYNRASGVCDLSKRFYGRTDGIIIYTGFYVSDPGLSGIPSDGPTKRLSVYVGISPENSLLVKRRRDRWRSSDEIAAFDSTIYRPAFTRYTRLFNPAINADYVILVDPRDRDAIEVVRPPEVRS